MRESLPIQAYIRLAKEKGLIYGDAYAPSSTRQATIWICPECGRRIRRSYHTMRYRHYGCKCQTGKTMKKVDYENLANRLGIEWIGKRLPKNAHERTLWQNENNQVFEASYKELAYDTIPNRLQGYLS